MLQIFKVGVNQKHESAPEILPGYLQNGTWNLLCADWASPLSNIPSSNSLKQLHHIGSLILFKNNKCGENK